MGTESVRLWRFTNPAGQSGKPGPGSWRTGPTPPEISAGTEIEFAWALLADEQMDATGRPPAIGDQLIGYVESRPGTTVQIVHSAAGHQFLCRIENDAVEAVGSDDYCVAAVTSALADAGVGV